MNANKFDRDLTGPAPDDGDQVAASVYADHLAGVADELERIDESTGQRLAGGELERRLEKLKRHFRENLQPARTADVAATDRRRPSRIYQAAAAQRASADTPAAKAGTAVIEDLRHTVIGNWHSRLADNKSPRRNHWQTKVIYYQATAELITAQPGNPLTWKSVVAAARPRGCRSTFYEVAGAHARYRMVDDLIADGRPDSMQIALRYLRTDPVEQLIDETKVWSFWPYRQRLIRRQLTAETTCEEMEAALAEALATWARRQPALAAAVGHTPPMCAVEDLTVLHGGQLAGLRAVGRLTDVLRHATLH